MVLSDSKYLMHFMTTTGLLSSDLCPSFQVGAMVSFLLVMEAKISILEVFVAQVAIGVTCHY